MSLNGEVTLTVHGLDVDNGKVRADAFLSKFRALLHSLKLADKQINEKRTYDYVIIGLEAASAHASLREKQIRKAVPESSVQYVGAVVEAVYNGDRNIARFPVEIISALKPLVSGLNKTFSHGELKFPGGNIVRIDDYLEKQIDKAIKRNEGSDIEEHRNFDGVAFETFDGIVKELDARGSLVRGKLVLTIGGKELDCIFREEDMEILRTSFDKRARIDGVAHYDGVSLLPVRIDVRKIALIKVDGDLLKWRHALRRGRGGGFDDG
jgi:hypothetical protein